MFSTHSVRLEPLRKDNFDTWKLQIEALLIKNDTWVSVNGGRSKPEVMAGDEITQRAAEQWEQADLKARSDLILAINPSELKQIKGCATSNAVWVKLHAIYQSKGPARKATLLKQLILHNMQEGEDVRDHISRFFHAMDKLEEMEVNVNQDLLTILLLYSFPETYENFRCVIECVT